MRTLIRILFLCFSCLNLSAAGDTTGADIVKLLHKNFYQGPCKLYTFSQKNTHYRNDSIIKHSDWQEVIEFPDKFRIDFGDKSEGNFVLFKEDSMFKYKAGSQVNRRSDSSSLLLLIGGMYYRQLDDVLIRLKHAGFDLSTYSEQVWRDRGIYVIGAKHNDLVSNQVWIDKKTLCVVRILQTINVVDMMDMRFEAHQPWCKGFIETKVSFLRNGHLEQVEEYYDIKPADSFPAR